MQPPRALLVCGECKSPAGLRVYSKAYTVNVINGTQTGEIRIYCPGCGHETVIVDGKTVTCQFRYSTPYYAKGK